MMARAAFWCRVADTLAAGLLLGLGTLGLLDAVYFTLVTYGWLRPDPRWLPGICRMDTDTCARIVQSRWAKVFGLPNSVYGIAWYAIVIVAGVAGLVTGTIARCQDLAGAALVVVAVSLLLVWALVARLRTPCALCYAAHVVNVLILGVAAWTCYAT